MKVGGGEGGEKRKEEVSFSPLPRNLFFFALVPTFSTNSAETLATLASGAKRSISTVLRKNRGL